jgi:starch-binding outer membrane protein, SusD/RagB family
MHRPRSIRSLSLIVAAAFTVGACGDLTVPDFNNPSLEDLENNPSPTTIRQAAQGLIFGARAQMGAQNGYVSLLGILGRESYNFDPADTRFITEMLIGPLDPGSPAFGANLFGARYANIRAGNTILAALGKVAGMSTAQLEATRGFVKTIQAYDLLHVLNTRDVLGAPIDVDNSPTGAPAPIASKAEVQARIVQLLNEAATHLGAAGTAFPFSLGPGFAGFDTPATFLTVNRALKARVDVYMGQYAAALTSLSGSFINSAGSLTLGVYHVFGDGSGDVQNTLFDPEGRAILAHPALVTDAQTQPGGAPDARLTAKVIATTPRLVQDVPTDRLFSIYTSTTSPIAIIRNEELILLRAEARWFTGDKLNAIADINLIRSTSGGLAPSTLTIASSDAAFVTELLYNRRYSLLFEGGHRWIDTRRLNRQTDLPLALPAHTRQPNFPFPEAECLARDPRPAPPTCPPL